MSDNSEKSSGKSGITAFLSSVQGIITSLVALIGAVTALIWAIRGHDPDQAPDPQEKDNPAVIDEKPGKPGHSVATSSGDNPDSDYETLDLGLVIDPNGSDLMVYYELEHGNDVEISFQAGVDGEIYDFNTPPFKIDSKLFESFSMGFLQAAMTITNSTGTGRYKIRFTFEQDGDVLARHIVQGDFGNGSANEIQRTMIIQVNQP